MNDTSENTTQLDLALNVLKQQLDDLERKDLLAIAAERSRRQRNERKTIGPAAPADA